MVSYNCCEVYIVVAIKVGFNTQRRVERDTFLIELKVDNKRPEINIPPICLLLSRDAKFSIRCQNRIQYIYAVFMV